MHQLREKVSWFWNYGAASARVSGESWWNGSPGSCRRYLKWPRTGRLNPGWGFHYIDDGYFELLLIRPYPAFQLLKMMISFFIKPVHSLNYMDLYRCREVTIYNLDHKAVQVDGEVIGRMGKVSGEILPQSLQVIVPPGSGATWTSYFESCSGLCSIPVFRNFSFPGGNRYRTCLIWFSELMTRPNTVRPSAII